MPRKKFTLEEIKNKLKNINPNIDILSNEYINNYTQLKCICKICNHEWKATWGNLGSGTGCPKCSGKKKLSLEEVKDNLNKINANIKILSDKYIDNKTKLKCKCLIDGYEWEAVWSSLQRGTGCPKCSGNLPDTIEEIKNKLAKINPNIQILSNEYIKNSIKLHCKCKIDGHEWYAKWGNLRHGTGCPICGKKSKDEKLRLTMKEIKFRLQKINPNIEILSNEYKNNETKLHCRCLIDNYEWYAKWQNLYQGEGCYICGLKTIKEKQMFSLEEIKEKLKIINPNVKIISDEYTGAKKNITCECLIDGNVWDSNWDKLCQGVGCPICGIRNNSGENHYHYNPNLTDEEREKGRIILGKSMENWRQKVFKKDNYTCQCCRNRSSKNNKVILNAHHLNGYNWDKEHRVDVDNGVTLCEDCHKEFHLLYGYGYNTKEQYEEWIENKLLNIAE